MKLSTKGRYGLRAMLDLAVNSTVEHVSLCSIAERQDISESYLEQVFSTLRKAGLVKSVKGAQGGYVLAGEPSDITVGMILRALEGDLLLVDEEQDGADGDNIARTCIRRHVWDKLNESVKKVVDSISLGDLVNEYGKMSGNYATMFYI